MDMVVVMDNIVDIFMSRTFLAQFGLFFTQPAIFHGHSQHQLFQRLQFSFFHLKPMAYYKRLWELFIFTICQPFVFIYYSKSPFFVFQLHPHSLKQFHQSFCHVPKPLLLLAFQNVTVKGQIQGQWKATKGFILGIGTKSGYNHNQTVVLVFSSFLT